MVTDPLVTRGASFLPGEEASRLLRRLLGFLFVCAALGLGVGPFLPGRASVASWAYAGLLVLSLTGLILLRWGRSRGVSLVLPGITWLVVMAAVCFDGGMRSPALFAAPAVIFLAGFLWSGRSAMALTLLTCGGTGWLAWTEADSVRHWAPRELADQWVSFVLSLLGSAFVMLVALSVITRALREARASEKRLRDLIEQSPDGVLVLDTQGNIEQINLAGESLFGQPRAALAGKALTALDLRTSESSLNLALLIERATLGELVLPVEVEVKRPNGTSAVAEAAFRTVKHGGKSLSLEVTFRETTERVRAERERAAVEAQLAHAQKLELVGQLAGGVAHDFNNYLAVILSAADLAVGQLRQGAPAFDALREIRAAGERSAALTRQLLAFSRKQAPRPELVDPNAVVMGTLKLMRRVLGERVKLKRVLGSDLGRVQIDPAQLEVALVNLCVNARDAMPDGGEISFTTAVSEVSRGQSKGGLSLSPGAYIAIEVRDTGSGMSQAVIDRCFEPFFTTKATGAGTGLGLSTVFGIIRQASGSVEVESVLGKGSTFRLLLPAVTGDVPSMPFLPSEGMLPTATGSILVVEDDDMVRGVACSILARGGYTVIEAASAEEALELAQTQAESFSLMVTDVVLPGIKGPALAQLLRQRWPKLPVLYVSGYVRAALEAEGTHLDDELLSKPFGASALLRSVRQRLT